MRRNAGFGRPLVAGAVAAALALFVGYPASAADSASRPAHARSTTMSAAGTADRPATPAPAGARAGLRVAAADGVCLKAYMQNLGWQNEQCASAGQEATAGAAGPGLRMEALTLSVGGSGFCVAGYVQDTGWQPWACAGAGEHLTVGTTGQDKRLEAVSYSVQAGTICGNSYVQDVGWNQNWYCGVDGKTNAIGTTGQDKRIEAASFLICRSAENC
ncbi:hypothetical protein [Amycolatopsis sp. NPDC059021]|uniref:hypothetical protein n=1 Tax=Amycolatopsis sp. NPDC059021 TaxID=3346704 RepID=UPI00366DD58D